MEVVMSVAYQLMPRPDWATTTTVAVTDGSTRTPEEWATAIFSVGSMPGWIKTLFGAREVVARLLRIPPGQASMLAVREVRDGEALIDTDDRHLRFVAGVRADGGGVQGVARAAVLPAGAISARSDHPVDDDGRGPAECISSTNTRAQIAAQAAQHRCGGSASSSATLSRVIAVVSTVVGITGLPEDVGPCRVE
jgi:hypothetical protein